MDLEYANHDYHFGSTYRFLGSSNQISPLHRDNTCYNLNREESTSIQPHVRVNAYVCFHVARRIGLGSQSTRLVRSLAETKRDSAGLYVPSASHLFSVIVVVVVSLERTHLT